MRRFLFLMAACLVASMACAEGQPPINVKPAAIAFAQTTGCPNAQVGVAYSCTLTVSGGNGTYKWTQPSGTVPPGLAWAAAAAPATTATISGTPTTYGSYAPVFSACDTEPTPLCGQITVDPHVLPAIQVNNTTNFLVAAWDPECSAQVYWNFSDFQIDGMAYICAKSGLCSGMTVTIEDSAGSVACSDCAGIPTTSYTLPSWVTSGFGGTLGLSFQVPADVPSAGQDQIILNGSC